MALVQANFPILSSLMPWQGSDLSTSATMDAAGESVFTIGQLQLEGGSGSKTLDTSGFIYARFGGTVTFANSGTKLRIGVQDIAAGTEDGTFDVYAELTGGTDTISNSGAWRRTQMATGSKSLTHGSLYAIGMEMTARGGADTVGVRMITPPYRGNVLSLPVKTADTGSGPARSNTTCLVCMIEFADGTLGWIQGLAGTTPAATVSTVTINTGTTPDEYAAVFKVPYKCTIDGIGMDVGNVATTDDFSLVLYSDPLGTPVAVTSYAVDADYYGSTAAVAQNVLGPITPTTLEANTWYAVSCLPTTANSVNVAYYALGTNCGALKRCSPFGANLKFASRTDGTGAFSETSTDDLPVVYLNVCQVDDGTSAGGGTGYLLVA